MTSLAVKFQKMANFDSKSELFEKKEEFLKNDDISN